MASSGKRTASVGVFVILLAAAGQAFGNIYAIDYRPTESVIDFSPLPEADPDVSPDPGEISSPFYLSYSGGTATFLFSSGNLARYTQSGSWTGSFAPNDPVLATEGTVGVLTIQFSGGITAFATQAQSSTWGAWPTKSIAISAYGISGGFLGSHSFDSAVEVYNDDSATLIGIASDSPISWIELSVTDETGSYVDFGINRISLTPVPVPGAVLLGLLGLSSAGLSLRRHG